MASNIGIEELNLSMGITNTTGNDNSNSKTNPASTSGSEAQFDLLDKTSSSTLKRNPKMELNKPDLLKLLSYLEGELQARDVVIAALKSEKLKQVIQQARYRPLAINDPYAALFRDSVAVCGGGTMQSIGYEHDHTKPLAHHQMESLENLVIQQRQTQLRMTAILKDAEEKHKKVIHELEEEKRKHEHDTAQGDDITYGLEVERTHLKQELESEKQARKKADKDLKKQQEAFEEERGRQKQIVLLLLAERKKIIMKYIEERKRSEDLAQILSEEKLRIDSMAEGLEEESKKSLSMEAELEKQQHLFDSERKVTQAQILKDENRLQELEMELVHLRADNESLRKSLESNTGSRVVPPRIPLTNNSSSAPQLPAKPMRLSSVSGTSGVILDSELCLDDPSGTGSSVAKAVQPTATVSSVPVCGPTTGIARSISPGQKLKQGATVSSPASSGTDQHFNHSKQVGPARKLSTPFLGAKPTQPQLPQAQPPLSAGVVPQPLPKKGTAPAGRGVPPPIPPNKPTVPPKRDPVARQFDTTEEQKKSSATTTGTLSKDKRPRNERDPLSEDFQQMLVTMANKT